MSTAPRSLGIDSVLDERLRMRHTVPTAGPLTVWVTQLIAVRVSAGLSAEIPTFDPADAGIDATVLLLMEAPGPMTNALNARPGSGFISSDNNDATAENLWHARHAAGLVDGALLWNVVPWYLGPAKVKPRLADLQAGAVPLRELIAMLPELHTVVTLGNFARRGWQRFGRPSLGVGLRTIETWHPSNQAMIQPGKRQHLVEALTRSTRDWRREEAGDRPVVIDHDRAGNAVAQWYANEEGDRVDLHPRWW
ncbi:uracil-DNA glycosylase [Cryobacterium sp. PH31-O1]|uniref:uracil-DNA glycosylase n=1 Tax=Cryobacterium sp. PH31-O1 TaxID=3046306 RepID=UPI0032D948A7